MFYFVKAIVRAYFILSGFTAHILILIIMSILFSSYITEHWRWQSFKKMLTGNTDITPVTYVRRVNAGDINFFFEKLPYNTWIKIHQQKETDPVFFQRQKHGGSAFNSNNLTLTLFGSNTHGADWNNSIYTFDMGSLVWQKLYNPDSLESYIVTEQGVPVAGDNKKHPWAMHTFDSVIYDAFHDQLVVASYPGHLKPGRFGNWISKKEWQKIKHHPTWFFDFLSREWSFVDNNSVDFFPYTVSYDTDKNKIIGFKPYGIYQFIDPTTGWSRIAPKTIDTYHTSSVYDNKNKAFILFGGETKDNSVYSFSTGSRQFIKMPTIGIRPPGDEHLPFAFHNDLAKAVAVVDVVDEGKSYAQTWLYDLKNDIWERIKSADFPFQLGMNYNMEYDSVNNFLVLVANYPGEPVAVWVLRL